MKSILTVAVLFGFVLASMNVAAEEKAGCSAPAEAKVKAPPPLKLTGKLVKEVKKEGDKEVVSFCVETKEGKIALPADAKVDEALVGKECKVVAEGEKVKGADGKETVTVKKLMKCEEVKPKEAKPKKECEK